MFVINPDSYLIPSYRISPFTTFGIVRNKNIDLKYSIVAKEYFDKRFGKGNWIITKDGKRAIEIALMLLNLPLNCKASIFTPSGNKYISGCVTKILEKYCESWAINDGNKGDLYFVNHEFGNIYKDISSFKNLCIPIIEDCCTTFFSQDESNQIGTYGDFSIFSFPKFFNIQIGGLLVGKNINQLPNLEEKTGIGKDAAQYISRVVGYELVNQSEIINRRLENWNYGIEILSTLGFSSRFSLEKNILPQVLMLSNNSIVKNLDMLKVYLYNHGIQNSIFYGEDAFFIPCHNNLVKDDIDYFKFVIQNYIEYNDNGEY